MMASFSKSEISVMKVRIGNLEPKETLKVEFELLGSLSSELPHTWTLRIPSHISPRYMTEIDIMRKLFDRLLKGSSSEEVQKSYIDPKI